MKHEFPITDEWLPLEIHPDTPQAGVLLADYFPGMNPMAFFKKLDARGAENGIRFGPQTRMSNSRYALEAGEFAKAHGLHDAFHEIVFRAFFTECKDIGNMDVILAAAKEIGLDAEVLREALANRTYGPNLEKTSKMAKENGIMSVPTFIIDGIGKITGAESIDKFRLILGKAQIR